LDHMPCIEHIGLKLDIFEASADGFFIKKCPECNTKTKLDKRHDGLCENNVDEWYSGSCPKCGEFLSHDVHLDDSIPWH